MMWKLIRFSLLIAFAAHLAACSSDEKKTDTAEATFSVAQEYEQGERYELAVQKYTEVKNKFPYSALATRAELAIADVHYKAEEWPEAQVAYQTFRDLHPTHPKVDYVINRIGLCFYNQLPETIDRDLSLAKDAITAFDDVIKRFPNSEFFDEARVKKDECLKKLAGKEAYIGDFYYRHEQYDSALPRYENILRKYQGLSYDAYALERAALSASKLHQREKASRYLAILQQRYPHSDEAKDAAKELR